MNCLNCGTEIKKDVKFCSKCGMPQSVEEHTPEEKSIEPEQEQTIKQIKEESKNDAKKRKFLTKKNLIICIVATIFFTVILGGFISVKFIKAEKAKETINLGNKYLEEGNYEEAILAFEETIKIEPKNIEARVNLSKVYVELKDYDKAENILKEAMNVDDKNKQPKEELIKLYIFQGKECLIAQKYQDAQDYFNKAINIDKSRVDTYNVIADYYEESEGNLDGAIDILTKGYTETKDEGLKERLDKLKNKIPGNTSSNIANGGIAAKQGEWIYYSNYSQNYSLYKVKTDGSNKTRLNNEKSSYINVIGNWIYYAATDGIYKMGVDGNNPTRLKDVNDYRKRIIDHLISMNNIKASDKTYNELIKGEKSSIRIESLNVVNNKLCYTVLYDDPNIPGYSPTRGIIVTSNIDGTEDKIVCYFDDKVKAPKGESTASPYNCMILGEWIYYGNLIDDSSFPLYRVKEDGTENSSFSEVAIKGFAASDNNIYYAVNSVYYKSLAGMYEVSTDLKEKVKIDVGNEKEIDSINVFGDYIYYSYKNQIYKIKKDGSNKTKVCSCEYLTNIYKINVVEGWIYFSGYSQGNEKVYYKIKMNGTEVTKVN